MLPTFMLKPASHQARRHPHSSLQGYYTYESVNFPGHYIRHRQYVLQLTDEDDEETDTYKGDVSWRLIHSECPVQ